MGSRTYPVGIAIALLLAGCSKPAEDRTATAAPLQVWFHSGQQAERDTIQAQLARYDATRADSADPALGKGSEAVLTMIPEGAYNSQVQAAALAGDLPDILEFDGPFLYNYVWQGHLRPLDDLLPHALQEDLLPSIARQGTFGGHLYAVGTFDSGLGLYARRSRLEAAGARIPTSSAEAWTVAEFETILAALRHQDPDGQVLDLKLNYEGEWFTYAFSPVLQSAGGDLIHRGDPWKAAGTLDGAASVSAMRHLQSWIESGAVDPNVDDAAFTAGRVPLSWSGHWDYRRYRDAWGEDLAVLPLPDFGDGTRTGQGSWCWGITTACARPQQAVRFLEFLLRPREVLAMCAANGAVPATRTAIERSPAYKTGGPLRLFAEQLTQGVAVPRPRTPAYPVITAAFQRAFAAIRDGADVQTTLTHAAQVIDQDIQDNRGYPPR